MAQITLVGDVRDVQGAPVAFANVQLLFAADSALARGGLTDDAGKFALEGIRPGAYRLHISFIGYEPHTSDLLRLDGQGTRTVAPAVLARATIELDGLSVTARRTLYEQRGDRMVVNVGNSVTLSGATALDVLSRSPGVVVNEQAGTIAMLGKDGVHVLIDGKRSYVPADGLVAFLEGLSAESLESVELITAPPAEFDAEGNAGFINLVLKDRPGDGVSGSASVTGGYGGGPVANASADVRYRRGRLAVFGNYAFLWNGQAQTFVTYREVEGDGGVTVATPSASARDPVQRNHNARLGLDYELTKRTTVGALVAAYDNRWSMDALNEAAVHVGGAPATLIVSNNDEVNHWRRAMANASVRHTFASDATASVDVDYLRYDNDNPTTYRNATTDVATAETERETLASGKETPLRIFVAKADYEAPESERWTWSAGVKGAFSRFRNSPVFPEGVEADWVGDIGVGEESSLREDVLAAYASVGYRPTSATTIEAGVRYEHTDSDLRAADGTALIERSYGDLFPSASVSHRLREGLSVAASFSRRITRPMFDDMAPFIYFLNPTTFFTGSTALQPATSNAVKADVTLGDVVASVQYAWEDAPIARYQTRVVPDANVHVLFPLNFDSGRTATALLAAPIALVSWWTTQNTGTLTWRAVEGERSGVPADESRTSYDLRTTHNVSLPADLTLEISAFYQSASLFGASEFGSLWQVDFGLQRALPGDAGRLTLSVDDVFDSWAWSFVEDVPSIPFYYEGEFDWSHRTVRLTYSRRFGSDASTRARSTASEEESGRVQ